MRTEEEKRKLARLPICLVSLYDLNNIPDDLHEFFKTKDGDYLFRKKLEECLKEQGAIVNEPGVSPKVLIYMHGRISKEMELPDMHKIIWIHSHPDTLPSSKLKEFDKVFSLSPSFTRKLNENDIPAETLIGMSSFSGKYNNNCEPRVAFVGSNRGMDTPYLRPIIDDYLKLEDEALKDRLEISGLRWKGLVPEKNIRGDHYPMDKLEQYYSESFAVLNDHHEDMRREGFLNPRILDVMASGGLVISDDLQGAEEIFEDALLTYDGTPEDLQVKLEMCKNERFRRKMIRKGQKIAEKYTTEHVASRFIDYLLSLKQEVKVEVDQQTTIVMGMHRSGTSLLSGLLHKAGIVMGSEDVFIPRPSPENPKGFFENVLFRRINDQILEDNGYVVKDWSFELTENLKVSTVHKDEILNLLVSQFNSHKKWGWKDPRQMLTADLWFEALAEFNLLKNTRVVFEFRHPVSVANSMMKRGNVGCIEQGLAIWYLYNMRALKALQKYSVPCIFMSMESISQNPEVSLELLSNFTEEDVSMEIYQEFFASDLVRSKAQKDIELEEIQSLYDELLHLEEECLASVSVGTS